MNLKSWSIFGHDFNKAFSSKKLVASLFFLRRVLVTNNIFVSSIFKLQQRKWEKIVKDTVSPETEKKLKICKIKHKLFLFFL